MASRDGSLLLDTVVPFGGVRRAGLNESCEWPRMANHVQVTAR